MKSSKPILYALGAAALYAINTPLSKLLLSRVPSTLMAAFLYLGAGLGVGLMYLFHQKKKTEASVSGKPICHTLSA